jgi:hypothetical protein
LGLILNKYVNLLCALKERVYLILMRRTGICKNAKKGKDLKNKINFNKIKKYK